MSHTALGDKVAQLANGEAAVLPPSPVEAVRAKPPLKPTGLNGSERGES